MHRTLVAFTMRDKCDFFIYWDCGRESGNRSEILSIFQQDKFCLTHFISTSLQSLLKRAIRPTQLGEEINIHQERIEIILTMKDQHSLTAAW